MSDHGPYSDFADMVPSRSRSYRFVWGEGNSPVRRVHMGTAAFGRPAAQRRSFFE
jgi:hypothetical protein